METPKTVDVLVSVIADLQEEVKQTTIDRARLLNRACKAEEELEKFRHPEKIPMDFTMHPECWICHASYLNCHQQLEDKIKELEEQLSCVKV